MYFLGGWVWGSPLRSEGALTDLAGRGFDRPRRGGFPRRKAFCCILSRGSLARLSSPAIAHVLCDPLALRDAGGGALRAGGGPPLYWSEVALTDRDVVAYHAAGGESPVLAANEGGGRGGVLAFCPDSVAKFP